MRLERQGVQHREGVTELADKELTENPSSSRFFFNEPHYSETRSCGFATCGFDASGIDTREKEFFLGIRARPVNGSTHWYQLTLTPRDMKILLSRYLEEGEMPDNERNLWEVLLDLWGKRLERQEQRKRKK